MWSVLRFYNYAKTCSVQGTNNPEWESAGKFVHSRESWWTGANVIYVAGYANARQEDETSVTQVGVSISCLSYLCLRQTIKLQQTICRRKFRLGELEICLE